MDYFFFDLLGSITPHFSFYKYNQGKNFYSASINTTLEPMWGTVISTSIITLLILFLLHQTYNHLQATLTVPKVNDLVRRPEQKYNEIDRILRDESKNKTKTVEVKEPEMKDELKNFLTLLRH